MCSFVRFSTSLFVLNLANIMKEIIFRHVPYISTMGRHSFTCYIFYYFLFFTLEILEIKWIGIRIIMCLQLFQVTIITYCKYFKLEFFNSKTNITPDKNNQFLRTGKSNLIFEVLSSFDVNSS